jgi:hypothetical protein
MAVMEEQEETSTSRLCKARHHCTSSPDEESSKLVEEGMVKERVREEPEEKTY